MWGLINNNNIYFPDRPLSFVLTKKEINLELQHQDNFVFNRYKFFTQEILQRNFLIFNQASLNPHRAISSFEFLAEVISLFVRSFGREFLHFDTSLQAIPRILNSYPSLARILDGSSANEITHLNCCSRPKNLRDNRSFICSISYGLAGRNAIIREGSAFACIIREESQLGTQLWMIIPARTHQFRRTRFTRSSGDVHPCFR